MNTYTKLREGWGVRATAPVQAGQTVSVTTKAGAVKTETVARVLWQGPDRRTGETVYLLAIQPGGGTDSHGHSIRSGASYRAGVTAPHGRSCSYCGSRECEGAWGGLCEQD